MAADMLTNLVCGLDDHDLSILHTQNGLVGVACVNPLQKQISLPASSATRVTGVAPASGDLDCAVYESGYP